VYPKIKTIMYSYNSPYKFPCLSKYCNCSMPTSWSKNAFCVWIFQRQHNLYWQKASIKSRYFNNNQKYSQQVSSSSSLY